jgi:RNA polymerase sigma factor (sigma-70 family)
MSTPSRKPLLRVLPGGSAEQASSSANADLVAVVRAAAAGDSSAFARLVVRFDRALRAVTRFYRLDSWDADDVIQTTWLRFAQYGRQLREPAALAGWLTTTARRESFRLLQARMRERPTDAPTLGESIDQSDPVRELLAAEQRDALHSAFDELPLRHRRLMTLLTREPDLSYEQVGRVLDMPIGSIGPIRARSLARLQRTKKLQALRASDT